MKRVAFAPVLLVAVVMLVAVSYAQDMPAAGMAPKYVVQIPEWQKLSALVGEWEGTVHTDGRPVTRVEVRMTADGSAIMHVMDRDTPHEMVTMFHPDGKRLLATHYCSAHNQPRLGMVKAPAPNQVAFEFVDGTNIAAGEGHMSKLVITIKDADHHDETWTYWDKGKDGPPETFSYTRKR